MGVGVRDKIAYVLNIISQMGKTFKVLKIKMIDLVIFFIISNNNFVLVCKID